MGAACCADTEGIPLAANCSQDNIKSQHGPQSPEDSGSHLPLQHHLLPQLCASITVVLFPPLGPATSPFATGPLPGLRTERLSSFRLCAFGISFSMQEPILRENFYISLIEWIKSSHYILLQHCISFFSRTYHSCNCVSFYKIISFISNLTRSYNFLRTGLCILHSPHRSFSAGSK